MEWVEAAMAASFGLIVLHIFFKAVRPTVLDPRFESLSGPSAVPDGLLWFKFASYRVVPVFVVCLFVAVTMERRGGQPLLATLSLGLLHGLVGTRSAWPGSLTPNLVPRLVSAGVLSLAGYVANASRHLLEWLVPSLYDMVPVFWTAVLTAVVVVYLTRHPGDKRSPGTEGHGAPSTNGHSSQGQRDDVESVRGLREVSTVAADGDQSNPRNGQQHAEGGLKQVRRH